MDPTGGAYSSPPDLLAGKQGAVSSLPSSRTPLSAVLASGFSLGQNNHPTAFLTNKTPITTT